jgi:hypothetical protein
MIPVCSSLLRDRLRGRSFAVLGWSASVAPVLRFASPRGCDGHRKVAGGLLWTLTTAGVHYHSPRTRCPSAKKTPHPRPLSSVLARGVSGCICFSLRMLSTFRRKHLVSPLAILDGEGGGGGVRRLLGELCRRGPPLCDPTAAHPTHLGGVPTASGAKKRSPQPSNNLTFNGEKLLHLLSQPQRLTSTSDVAHYFKGEVIVKQSPPLPATFLPLLCIFLLRGAASGSVVTLSALKMFRNWYDSAPHCS